MIRIDFKFVFTELCGIPGRKSTSRGAVLALSPLTDLYSSGTKLISAITSVLKFASQFRLTDMDLYTFLVRGSNITMTGSEMPLAFFDELAIAAYTVFKNDRGMLFNGSRSR